MLTEEQMKARKGRVTSSVIYDVIHNPYRAWVRIMQLETPEQRAALENQNNIKIGNELEDLVRRVGADRLGVFSEKAPFRVHPVHAWAGDSADAIFYTDADDAAGSICAVGEVKTHGSGVARRYSDEASNVIPEHVLTQCRWHLIHWPEVDVCHTVALLGGWELRLQVHGVARNEEEEGKLLEAGARFHRDHILPGKPPALDASEDSRESLRQRYSEPGEAMLTAGELTMGLIDRRKEIKAKMKPMEAELKALDNQIKDAIGNRS